MNFRLLALSCFVIGSFVGSNAVIRVAGTTDQQYLDYAKQFPAVGKLDFVPPNDYRSATLIADNVIITAGHSFSNSAFTCPFRIGGQIYTAQQWVRDPAYNVNALQNGHDITICKLDRRVTNVAPVPWNTGSGERGLPGVMVGFGASGVGNQTFNDFAGRAGTNLIEGYYTKQLNGSYTNNWPNVLVTDFDDGTVANNSLTTGLSPFSTEVTTPLEGHVGNGDSGGGLLAQFGGVWTLVGVISAKFRFDSNTNTSIYGSCSLFSRTAVSSAFIQAQLQQPGRVEGKLTYQDFVGDVQQHPVTIQITNPGSSTVIETQVVTPNIAPSYSFTSSLRGTYDVYFKGNHWLRKKMSNVVISATATTIADVSLLGGDVDNDNAVTIFDYIPLSDSFDKVVGDSGFNANADLDGDDAVTIFDYITLSGNFDKTGD